MAKKVRRVKKKSNQQKSKTHVVDQAVLDSPAVPVDPPESKVKSTGDEFRIEYAYVMNDLRRVLILAAALFLLLIALNLLLQ